MCYTFSCDVRVKNGIYHGSKFNGPSEYEQTKVLKLFVFFFLTCFIKLFIINKVPGMLAFNCMMITTAGEILILFEFTVAFDRKEWDNNNEDANILCKSQV